jgi:anti-sigma regulatory factor (Ser/Thr protein kinase)
VQDAIDDLQTRALARDVTLENSGSRTLVALADSDRMRQVMSNLLDNAIKYGRREGGTSRRSRAGLLPDGRIEIAVVDDGPGIPKESQERIFERFYRVDKARSREQGGTGLGLAIVKHVVQAHGGEVRVESGPGSGRGSSSVFRRPGPRRTGRPPELRPPWEQPDKGCPEEPGHREGENPRPDDPLDDPHLTALRRLVAPDAHDGRRDDVGRRDGYAERRGRRR